jgi:hypothetical protein
VDNSGVYEGRSLSARPLRARQRQIFQDHLSERAGIPDALQKIQDLNPGKVPLRVLVGGDPLREEFPS